MKIAFLINSTGWGGLEMNTLKLARSLREKGLETLLITQPDSTIFTKGEGAFSEIILIRKNRKYFDLKSSKAIAKALKKENARCVLVCDNKDLDVINWTKRFYLKNLKIIYTQHMQIGINKRDFLHTIRYNSIDRWVSPLEYLKEEVTIRTKFPVDRIQVIPFGLNTRKFTKPTYSKNEARKKMGIDHEVRLLGIIGRIDEKKGQMFLVKAFEKLVQKGEKIELLIFGSATVNDDDSKKYDRQLREYIEQSNLGNIVHMMDYNADVALFYNAIDIFIIASYSETFGMVTIEGMLSELPIIGTNEGGTKDILENGELGYLFEYENQKDFIECYFELINDFPKALEKASKAKQIAKETYHLDVEVEGIKNIISDVLRE